MLTMTFARILTWSVTFAYLKYWGFVIMSLVALATARPVFVQWKKFELQAKHQALLGAIVAMFAPCIVVNDFGRIFLSTALNNSFSSILSLICLTLLVRFDLVIFSHPKAFRTDTFHNETSLANFTTEEIFQKEHPFFVYIISILTLWIISIGANFFLHKYLDPIKRFKISKLLFKCLVYLILAIICILMLMAFIVFMAIILMLLVILFPFILWDLFLYFLYKSGFETMISLQCFKKTYDYISK